MTRWEQFADALLASDNPTKAIAHELADQHARLDALVRRVDHLDHLAATPDAKEAP